LPSDGKSDGSLPYTTKIESHSYCTRSADCFNRKISPHHYRLFLDTDLQIRDSVLTSRLIVCCILWYITHNVEVRHEEFHNVARLQDRSQQNAPHNVMIDLPIFYFLLARVVIGQYDLE
jgi:hypothetical protein